jgi:hypothetical protein
MRGFSRYVIFPRHPDECLPLLAAGRASQGYSSIKPRDVADLLDVTEVQGSRILRELREAEVLAIGSQQTRGRGVFHVRGPRFDDAARRHGILS